MGKPKLTIEGIRDYVRANSNCELVSNTYINIKNKLLFKCECGNIFETNFSEFKHKNKRQCNECSRKNYTLIRSNQVIFNCENCNKETSQQKSKYDKHERHYCSQKCKNEHQKHTLKGDSNPNWNGGEVYFKCDVCGKESHCKSSVYENTKYHYCSNECVGNGKTLYHSGVNSINWNPNISEKEREEKRSAIEYDIWRREVFEKDKYTCLCCGDNKGHNLNAHHLDGYNWCKEKRYVIDNGVTLCETCHKEFHSIYGNGNNVKTQFEEFLLNKYKNVI